MNHGAQRLVGAVIAVDLIKNNRGLTRLGITVTKRYGDAHLRNRFKRLVREAFRLCRHRLPKGVDLNVKPRQAAEKATLVSIEQELIDLLTKKFASHAQVQSQ
jgi:ribonuclease P protein component